MFSHVLNVAVLTLLSLSIAFADEAGDTPDQSATDVEEITVVGEESVPRLRSKLRRLDQEFFRLYNELNTNDELDMICKRETRIGSQMPRTVCRSRLHRERQSEQAQDLLDEDGSYFAVSRSWRARHYKKVRDNVMRVLGESAELTQMMESRAALRRRIETLKQEKADR
ncbi:MAG: hypothetical protein QNJ05_01225 [Woeseiaceae bacterium]|nr:hypothetical protein [Woeseiaceae bacterium]